MNLLLYSDPLEPITEVLLKWQKELRITPLSVENLLKNSSIFDKINDLGTTISWILPRMKKITNSKDVYLINRVFYCHEHWFEDFKVEDRTYAQTEFWAYLLFAINAFPNKTEAPGVGSLTGDCYSLPKQWTTIKKANLDIEVPEFYLGMASLLPPEWEKDQVVFGQIYNFYYWKPNSGGKIEKNIFAFKKPKGQPVLAFVMDKKAYLYSMQNESSLNLSKSIEKEIKKTALQISDIFGYFLSEILFFVHEEKLFFGMVYNCPLAAKHATQFESNVLLSMQTILKKR